MDHVLPTDGFISCFSFFFSFFFSSKQTHKAGESSYKNVRVSPLPPFLEKPKNLAALYLAFPKVTVGVEPTPQPAADCLL